MLRILCKVVAVAAASQPTTGVVRSMSADLTGATHGFFGELTADFTTFEGIIQTGVNIDDPLAPPLATPMPWQHLKNLTAEDFEAIYAYLAQVQRDQPVGLTTDKPTQDASYYCVDDTLCDTAAGEHCDLTAGSPTIHECTGRACAVNTDCRACQTCVGATSCGAPIIATATCAL